jgi:hypothetical protein
MKSAAVCESSDCADELCLRTFGGGGAETSPAEGCDTEESIAAGIRKNNNGNSLIAPKYDKK